MKKFIKQAVFAVSISTIFLACQPTFPGVDYANEDVAVLKSYDLSFSSVHKETVNST